MTRPIAKPAYDSARPRRRQGSSPLFRTTLALALVITCVLATPVVLHAARVHIAPPVVRSASEGGVVSGQVALAGLAPGACVSYSPNRARNGKTVFIDPGHGGLDPGVVGTVGGRQVLEKDVALSVGTRLAELLRGGGYRVVMSRTADSSVTKLGPTDSVTGAMTASAVHRDLISRAACANAAASSVLLSIHFNAFDDPAIGGAETFYDGARPFSGANKRFAEDLQSALVAGLGVADRGVWADDGVGTALTTSGSVYDHLIELGPAATGWVDDPSQMPGALVEPMFLTNPDEARFAASTGGQQRIASALRTGLEKYFSS
jgi:N-acetylmuramoyl-L-alanine amidase